MSCINILGAGLAGLSAAIELSKQGISTRLISLQPSERAQSVLVEGGINAALDTMGEGDTVQNHLEDTLRGGCSLADPEAVKGLTTAAPEIVRWLISLGVPFNLNGSDPVLRSFGGQKLKRTAYARSSTGKMIMTALIDEARKFEAQGLIERWPRHELIRLLLEGDRCLGLRVRDTFTGEMTDLPGSLILCSGGMNGIFPEMTTGTTQNTGDCAAIAFSQGVTLADLEMIQYHPTTVGIPGKRCLVTEAARGEGGRLWTKRNGKNWYFLEEKYPELGNLMPRDVVSREMFFVRRRADCEGGVFLDMTGLPASAWENKLSDLREELIHYLALDPRTQPIPVHEGIHYFMGGIHVDQRHRTSHKGLYAAGECACQYHGANRLGGNSMLGAIYGGRVAARTAAEELSGEAGAPTPFTGEDEFTLPHDRALALELRDVLLSGLGIVRSETELNKALASLEALEHCPGLTSRDLARIRLGRAMLLSARDRRESRGAHYRSDFPERDEAFQRQTLARWEGEKGTCVLTPDERRAP